MFRCLNKNLADKAQFSRLYHSKSGIFGYNPTTSRPSIADQKYKIPSDVKAARNQQSNAFRWIEAYRKFGHKLAAVDAVSFEKQVESIDELNPEFYGLSKTDKISTNGMLFTASNESTVCEIEEILRQVYCKNCSAEFFYIQNTEEKEWLSENYEKILQEQISDEEKKTIAELLIKSEAFDNFLATKFPTVKRYGGEGAESMMAFFERIFDLCGKDDVEHIVLGMPHRGRNNLLTTMLNVRPAKFFKKYQGNSEFASDSGAMGDVASHYDASVDMERNGKAVHISMLRNPSHLEAVNPVSMGKARSKQLSLKDYSYKKSGASPSTKVLNIQLHGDAAYPGQGVNQECLMMAYVPHFDIGGSIHMVVNNQIGFTTPAKRGRSTDYTTDLAKSVEAPVFHVNGDDPELLMQVTKLAFEYQRKFKKDVFIDLNCFRRWGHNELDDPTFTNPALYEIVNNRRSVPDLYAEKLIKSNVLTEDTAKKIRNDYMDYLNKELTATSTYEPEKTYFQQQWTGFKVAPDSITYWDTGLDYSLLSYIGRQSVSYPRQFNIHPHLLKTHVAGRLKKLEEGKKIDWATAEALAIGSLLYQGYNVRLSGEDVGRGTFSHRHAMLVDQKLNEMYIPLNDLDGGLGGKLEVAHSILSEEAVLGFEYGMAIDNPNNLIIWEAQFGDFANGAQIIIDNFIATGETKWMQSNGMVMLLPHGYDGAASEHSSCRMERFLQLTDSKENAPDSDNVNLQIVNPSTPAQYFHVLRRQMVRDFRKPLIVVAPKILLRLSDAASQYTDFLPGTQFQNIIGDVRVNPAKVTKVILCSGKHYYTLDAERVKQNIDNVAIIRVESLVPFPVHEIQEALKKYSNARKFIWSQEESRNAGAWSFVRPRFEYLIGKPLSYIGRAEGSTTATGDGKTHRMEAEAILTNTFTS